MFRVNSHFKCFFRDVLKNKDYSRSGIKIKYIPGCMQTLYIISRQMILMIKITMNGRATMCKGGISHFGSIGQGGISLEIPSGNYHTQTLHGSNCLSQVELSTTATTVSTTRPSCT